MTKILAERVGLVGSLVGLVAFVATLIGSSQAVVALGVVGYLYMLSVLPVGSVVVWRDFEPRMRWTVLPIFFLLALAVVLKPPKLDHQALHSFGLYQWIGLTIFLLVVVLWVALSYLNDRARHKNCPDCAERVLAKARVCRHCGFRWEARPAVAGAEEG